jgi:predicted Ser/Thr protein kinase
MHPQRTPSSSSDEGRFPSGTLLGERYRVIGLVGRGGMGEVYRAHDLKLEQQVALKFLPPATARDSRLRERFRGEVRIARQVSHRNVCRVYDLGEIDGATYISMEYVDGEDLGSLLRRIGRLPGDKAIEFARRLCAGLAAAHEKGVLHRDLKPANIMIDGRGQVIIMDFGLAAVVDAVHGADIRSGTPDYMAPEQKDGREVTVRSDIYSLGLVLAEMFTGQKASRDSASKLSTTVKDLDPAVERVIQRCLDVSPSKRPQTALDVARALPGGDPLAEALAAGDTPSPEMVAASDDTGVLSVRAAVVCLAIVVAGLAALVFWGSRYSVINMTPMPYSPDVLRQKSHELAARLGYTDGPLDEFYTFDVDQDYQNWAERMLKPADRRAQMARQEPSPLFFLDYQSPRYMVPLSVEGVVSLDDPTRGPGSIDMTLNPQGRLVFLRAMPKPEMEAASAPFDWNKLFDAAGLDASRWTAAEPQEIPPVAFDERKAWTGTYPGQAQMPLRIQAAAWKGRPVYFEIFGPWRVGGIAAQPLNRTWVTSVSVVVMVLAPALLFALLNLRSGRGDRVGAWRLACFQFICALLGGLTFIHHVPTTEEVGRLLAALGPALFFAGGAWTLYIALEPYVRRHWPQALIGWTRAISGKLRDPMVAGHILAGLAAGICVGVILDAQDMVESDVIVGAPVLGTFQMIGAWLVDLVAPPSAALSFAFFFLLLRLIFRRTWIALVVISVLSLSFSILLFGARGVSLLVQLLTVGIVLAVSVRFGVLALAAASVAVVIRIRYPVTSQFSAWYAPLGWMTVALVLGVALWCFRNALGGRKVLTGDILDS